MASGCEPAGGSASPCRTPERRRSPPSGRTATSSRGVLSAVAGLSPRQHRDLCQSCQCAESAGQDRRSCCSLSPSRRQVIRIKPDLAEAHSNLAIVLKRQGRLDEAIAAFREAIRINPGLPALHFNLGIGLRITADSTPPSPPIARPSASNPTTPRPTAISASYSTSREDLTRRSRPAANQIGFCQRIFGPGRRVQRGRQA
jgi:hypothetical protein